MFSIQSRPGSSTTFENVFFQRYTRLSEWALQLTAGDRTEAEDLVQELYVRIAGIGPVHEHIQSAEDYLFSMLRNLHYSRQRRASTSVIGNLSIADYESVEWSIRAVDRNGILFIREDLHQICDYLCRRKESSRAASVFILRYFLGYFPNEIMQVVRTTRANVDKAIQVIRREARLELERPGVLQEIAQKKESKRIPLREQNDSLGLFAELRRKLFRSCEGMCFKRSELANRYKQPGKVFNTSELAHLVSCSKCLDAANKELGLPELDERSPDETIDRNTPRGPSGSGGTSLMLLPNRKSKKPQDMQKRMRRRLEEIKQHRPQRLFIAVDGEILASQKVTAEYSDLIAELNPASKLQYIEVLSEQNGCLAFVKVLPLVPAGELSQMQEFQLSDGRTMTVSISFVSKSPSVRVMYRDPLLAPAAAQEKEDAANIYAATEKWEGTPALQTLWQVGADNPLSAFWRKIRMNPLLTSAMLFAVCSVVCFFLWTRGDSPISANAMLAHAEQSDTAVVKTNPGAVIYQKVRISSSGHSVEHAMYRDPQKRHHFKQQPLGDEDQRLKQKLSAAGVDWDDPLSAADYQNWHDRARGAKDTVAVTNGNLLKLTTAVANSEVVQQSLTVRGSDFHPVAREVVLRDGTQASTTVEVAELNYAVIDLSILSPAVFDDAITRPEVLPVPPVLPHVEALPSAAELYMTELEVRQKLHELGADLGEDIHIVRTPRNVDVSGIISTDERAQTLKQSLYSFPHVELALRTPQEMKMTHLAQAQGPVNVSTVEQSLEPPLLDEFLKQQFPSESMRTSQVNRLLAEAGQCAMRARALNELLQRYHSLNDPAVRRLADDHLQALAESSAAIGNWMKDVPHSADAQQGDSEPVSAMNRGAALVEASRGLEHDLTELVSTHSTEQTSSQNAAAIVVDSRWQLNKIQQMIVALR